MRLVLCFFPVPLTFLLYRLPTAFDPGRLSLTFFLGPLVLQIPSVTGYHRAQDSITAALIVGRLSFYAGRLSGPS